MERRERATQFDPYVPPERYARRHHFAVNEDPYSPFPPPPSCPPGCEPVELHHPNPQDEDVAEVLGCEVCEGPLYYLGPLGRLQYYACRNCGSEHAFHTEALHDEDPYG